MLLYSEFPKASPSCFRYDQQLISFAMFNKLEVMFTTSFCN